MINERKTLDTYEVEHYDSRTKEQCFFGDNNVEQERILLIINDLLYDMIDIDDWIKIKTLKKIKRDTREALYVLIKNRVHWIKDIEKLKDLRIVIDELIEEKRGAGTE